MALCLHFTSLYLKNILSVCYVLYLKPRWYHKLPQEAFFLLKAPKSSSPAPSRPAFRRKSKLRLRQSLGGAVGLSRFQQGWGISSNTPCTAPRPPTNLSISLPNTSRIFLSPKETNYSSLPYSRAPKDSKSCTIASHQCILPQKTHPPCLWARSSPTRPSTGSQQQHPAPEEGNTTVAEAGHGGCLLTQGRRSDSCLGIEGFKPGQFHWLLDREGFSLMFISNQSVLMFLKAFLSLEILTEALTATKIGYVGFVLK